MPVDDTFQVEVEMPGGKRNLVFVLKSQGTLLTGCVEGPFGRYPFRSGNFSRNNCDWVINLKSGGEPVPEQSAGGHRGILKSVGMVISDSLSGPPLGMPYWRRGMRPKKDLKVSFSGRINGDTIFGEMTFGDYAVGTFRGSRVPVSPSPQA
ncbi:MAG: hypothetical protein GX631_06405 [Dehalococcoidales bacterium]|nr:hypothetical protein [Dehalococcoidales bacterium]